MRRHCLTSLILTLLAAPVLAEEVDKQQVAAIAPLAWMAGEWRGEASMKSPAGDQGSLSWERVTLAAGGTALLIQGRHHRRNADGSAGEVVHDTAGLLQFQPRTGKYRFVTQLANGRSGDFEARVEGQKMIWFLPAAEGQQMRYEIQRNAAGQWVEDGFFCRGEACQPFFKMTLTQQP
jgi:hypothetical protein